MYYFVVNPAAKSGHGMEVWNLIKPVLDEKSIEYTLLCSEKKGDITALVSRVTSQMPPDADGMTRLVIVGGDGTLNEAVQGVKDYSKLLMGYVPAGSANDFATNTGISQQPLEALEQILSCSAPTRFDLGYMTYDDDETPELKHYFTSSCGIGYDAEVSREAQAPGAAKDFLDKLKLGSFIYLFMAIKTLVRLKRGDCVMTLDDGVEVKLNNFLFVCSMIYRYEGGGFFFSPDADPSDGILDACVFGDIPKWKVLVAFPSAYKGTHYRYKNVEPYTSKTVSIRTSMPFWVQLDGEVEKKSSHISIVCEKQVLQLLK